MSIVGGEESESSSESEEELLEPQLVQQSSIGGESKSRQASESSGSNNNGVASSGAPRPRKLVNRRITDTVQLAVARHLRGAEKRVLAVSQVMDKSLVSVQKIGFNLNKAAQLMRETA